MTEIDLLNDLLSSNPNLPVAKGELVLLRLEMKSEFKVVRGDIAELKSEMQAMRLENDQKFGQIGQKFAQIDQKFEQINQRFEQIDRRFEQIERRLDEMQRMMMGMAQQIALLVERSVAVQ